MFGRIFGRGKNDADSAVCASCGRTLLAGEWTRKIVDDDGGEHLICSLCGQAAEVEGREPVATVPAPANNGRIRETRTEAPRERGDTDAVWRAIKEKDAEIERLQEELAAAKAERQSLAARLAHAGADDEPELTAEPLSPVGDSSEPGERTWGETPAEFAAEMAALRDAVETAEPAAEPAADVVKAEAGTADVTALEEEPVATSSAPDAFTPESAPVFDVLAPEDAGPVEVAPTAETADEGSATPADEPAVVTFEDTQPITIAGEMPVVEDEAAGLPGEPVPAVEPTDESAFASVEQIDVDAAAASLTLLQRGVDLLNVSRVPHKVAETNEQLGLSQVHAGFDGETVTVTFIWSMGWYRFRVDLESGQVKMDERGYEDRSDLQPNAAVRADGTVHLAPAQISRAAGQRAQAEAESERQAPAPAPPAAPQPQAPPETPSDVAQKPPEILSKSLLGQRSDDEAASWEKTSAREFNWDR